MQLAGGDVLGGAASTGRRIELLRPLALDRAIYERCEAFHMIQMVAVAAGDLASARRYALQRLELPFYREEADLAVDWLLVRAVLSGELHQAVDLAERFRRGWERAGRPALGGIAHGPAAAALALGLRGDDDARSEWLDIFTIMNRVVAPLAGRDAGLPRILDALLHLHRADHDAALAALDVDPEDLRHWHTGAWRQWHAAIWAEASVLARRPDATERIARARVITTGNPIAAPLVDRPTPSPQPTAPPADIRRALHAAGCRYQWARTLALAGGREGGEGERALAEMGAAAMKTSP